MIRSIDILAQKEYNYEYEDDKIVRATESKIELNSNEIVISKTLLNSVRYYYNDEGQMTKKVITFANGSYTKTVLVLNVIKKALQAFIEWIFTRVLKTVLKFIPYVGSVLSLFAGPIYKLIKTILLTPQKMKDLKNYITKQINTATYSLCDYVVIFFKQLA